tara:strand:+ start:604 stop:1098 length:495 start_codon:yes stop_codon:yes gene_type:complete
MNYTEAVEYQRRMNGGELVQILTERGSDIYESDRSNAALRAEYGDTPYAAPDVVPELGHCDGGDAWPQCCTGHRFKEWVFDIICTHQMRAEDEGETFDGFDWESTLPNCAKRHVGKVARIRNSTEWEMTCWCGAYEDASTREVARDEKRWHEQKYDNEDAAAAV